MFVILSFPVIVFDISLHLDMQKVDLDTYVVVSVLVDFIKLLFQNHAQVGLDKLGMVPLGMVPLGMVPLGMVPLVFWYIHIILFYYFSFKKCVISLLNS